MHMKIVITGGHPAPALAVIKELQKRKYKDIHFIGRKYAQAGGSAESYEYKQVEQLKVPFYNLEAGKLIRTLSSHTWDNAVRMIKGFYDSYKLLSAIKPDIILSFGGYIALPVCYVGKILGIQIVTHEQTIAPGAANSWIAKIADKILISFPETLKYFNVHKTRVTGNPIRPQALQSLKQPIKLVTKKPVIYITGGSLGSHSINKHVENILPKLLKKYEVIHQAGNIPEYDDLKRLSRKRTPHYHVRPHFASDEVGWVFRTADIVISRSGANTTFELIALRKPCILIPLPWSVNGEQEKHAKLIAQAGAGEIFDQHASSKELNDMIDRMYAQKETYRKNFRKLKQYVHKDAAQEIVDEVIDML